MSTDKAGTMSRQAPVAARARLPRSVAFVLVAYAFGATMLGTTLPTPLYPLYQREFGFASLLTTVIYAVYAAGVIAMLLLAGRASDGIGRRGVMLVALACSAASAVVFLTDAGLPALFAGRVLSGLSAGLVTGTATVALVEMAGPARRTGAALIATGINMLGLGCGPLLAGLLAAYAPAPLRLPYLTDLVLLVPAAVGILLVPETAPEVTGRLPRPQRPAVAREARAVFVPAAVAVFAAFAVFGLLTAIEPGFLATVLHRPGRALAGLVVFSMFAGSAAGQVGLSWVPTRVALPAGCLVLVAGLAGVAGALLGGSLPLLVAGTVVVGVGQSLSFRAGMAAITAAAPAQRRAETVSSFFVVAYVGISIPVVLVGVVAALTSLRTAGLTFTAAVAALSLAALAGVLHTQHRTAT